MKLHLLRRKTWTILITQSSLFFIHPLLLLGQRYPSGNPVTQSVQGRVIIISATRDLRLRLLVREKQYVMLLLQFSFG